MIGKLLSGKKAADDVSSEQTVAEDNHQLVELFNKRNELKRAFDRTTAERDQLLAEVSTLRKSNSEMTRKLGGLEKALTDPRVAPNVLVYYSLMAIWRGCQQVMSDTAQELRASYEESERNMLMKGYSKRQTGEMDELDKALNFLNQQIDEIVARKQELEKALKNANRFWHYLERKKLRGQLAGLREERAPLERDRDEQLEKVNAVRDKEPPRYGGLSRTAMRAANTHLIALAQYFYVHFSDDNISALTHEAARKLPHEVNYGGPQTCLELQKKVNAAHAALKKTDNRSEQARKRAEHLKSELRFADDKSTVPDVGSVNTIQKSASNKLGSTLIANVIDLDSWHVMQYLLVPEEKKKAQD